MCKLIKNLEFCGIRGNALNLIKSFICNSSHQVRLGGIFRDKFTNSFSVPQGTVLSPILFVIYTNGFLILNLNADILWYGDGTIVPVKNKKL